MLVYIKTSILECVLQARVHCLPKGTTKYSDEFGDLNFGIHGHFVGHGRVLHVLCSLQLLLFGLVRAHRVFWACFKVCDFASVATTSSSPLPCVALQDSRRHAKYSGKVGDISIDIHSCIVKFGAPSVFYTAISDLSI